jgi:hypothetical protein
LFFIQFFKEVAVSQSFSNLFYIFINVLSFLLPYLYFYSIFFETFSFIMPFSVFVKQFETRRFAGSPTNLLAKLICHAPTTAYQNLLNQLKNEKIISPAFRCRDGNSSNRKHRKPFGRNQTN